MDEKLRIDVQKKRDKENEYFLKNISLEKSGIEVAFLDAHNTHAHSPL
jgi:hypothetical protein